MLDHTTLSLVAEQMMGGREIAVNGRTSRVSRIGAQRLRTVRFLMGGTEYQAIEQNPEKPSRWGKLAREGRRVAQVRDLGTQKYVAAVVDGKVTEYSGEGIPTSKTFTTEGHRGKSKSRPAAKKPFTTEDTEERRGNQNP